MTGDELYKMIDVAYIPGSDDDAEIKAIIIGTLDNALKNEYERGVKDGKSPKVSNCSM